MLAAPFPHRSIVFPCLMSLNLIKMGKTKSHVGVTVIYQNRFLISSLHFKIQKIFHYIIHRILSFSWNQGIREMLEIAKEDLILKPVKLYNCSCNYLKIFMQIYK